MIRRNMKNRSRLPIRSVVLLLGCLVVGTACVSLCSHQARPQGIDDPRAEIAIDRMWDALDYNAWENTGAIRWRMASARPLFLWDRKRDWVLAQYDSSGSAILVYLALATRRGVATTDQNVELPAEEQQKWLVRAYADWANDSFWLIAPFKARDPGTLRSLPHSDDQTSHVLVSYQSGGVTPGDAYLWHLDEDGTPVSWQMWVKVIPIGGVKVQWKDWRRLATGVRIAHVREGALGIQMKIDPLEAASNVEELVGGDPFAAFARRLAVLD